MLKKWSKHLTPLVSIFLSFYQGGFDMICSGRDKIETPEQVEQLIWWFIDFVMSL